MPRRTPATPKLLLSMTSAVITAFALIYGVTVGWFSTFMIYFYIFFIVYAFAICKGNREATCYTIAGAVTSTAFLLALKFLDPILGTIIGFVTAYFVSFVTDILVKCDWRYFNLREFDLSSFSMEHSIQFAYGQHVPVSSPPPSAETEVQDAKVEQQKRKNVRKHFPSRKERKAEAKKEKKDRQQKS